MNFELWIRLRVKQSWLAWGRSVGHMHSQGVELWATENKSIEELGGGLEQETSRLQVQLLTHWLRCLLYGTISDLLVCIAGLFLLCSVSGILSS